MLILLAILLLVGSLTLSVFLTAVAKTIATRLGFVANPAADRYHQSAVPIGGGVAIFATLIIIMVSCASIINFLIEPGHLDWLVGRTGLNPTDFLERMGELAFILLSALILFGLGLLDDKKHLKPFFKLLVQFVVAIIAAIFADVSVGLFIENKIVTTILSVIWIMLIINAFNFLDNMDGAAAGVAVITSSILFVAAAINGQFFVGGLALIFIGTLLGFLVFNFPPAKIFMGDAGSLVVGFFVALLTVRTTYYQEAGSGQWYAVFMPLVVMAVPLYDFTSVTLLRISQGKSPFIGDTQHFSHRLKRHGLTDTQTVLTLYLATLCTGLGAIFLYQVNITGAILIFIQTFMILAIIAVFETTTQNEKASD